jgi:anti-anti-sigma factor
MSTVTIPPLSAGTLKAIVDLEGTALKVHMSGNADLQSAAQLEAWLHELHTLASRLAIGETVVDLRTLEFMNSSCFKGFVSWIGEVQDSDLAGQYRIRFLSDSRMLWQRRSLHALRCFAADLITVETN